MSTKNSEVVPEDNLKNAFSSVDLMKLSPERNKVADDLLTGNNETDVSMQSIPVLDDMFYNPHSLDFLIRRPRSRYTECHIDPGKESLYAKFDPLFSKSIEKNLSQKEELAEPNLYDAGYETASATVSHFETNESMENGSLLAESIQSMTINDKPTQIVLPSLNAELASNSVASSCSAPALVRRSFSAVTSAEVLTDKLISVSGDSAVDIFSHPSGSKQSQKTDYQSLKGFLEKQDHNLFELQLENEELHNISQEIKTKHTDNIEKLEREINKLSKEVDVLKEEENSLKEKLKKKTVCNEQITDVVEEYEKTISSLIAQRQKDKFHFQERQQKLEKEKDEVLSHLDSMESSYNDFMLKYEKRKASIKEQIEKENILLKKLTDYENELNKFDEMYGDLKKTTSEKLDKANEVYANMIKSHNTEVTKLNAIIEKQEVKMHSLQESLDRKTKDNEEITRICDQLISKVR